MTKKCPFLKNHKYCTHNGSTKALVKKVICPYQKPINCPYLVEHMNNLKKVAQNGCVKQKTIFQRTLDYLKGGEE
jgi:hypothetical protein